MAITCELHTASYTEAIRRPLTQNVKVVSYHVNCARWKCPVRDNTCFRQQHELACCLPSKNFHAIAGIVNCYNFSGKHFASISVKSLESVSMS